MLKNYVSAEILTSHLQVGTLSTLSSSWVQFYTLLISLQQLLFKQLKKTLVLQTFYLFIYCFRNGSLVNCSTKFKFSVCCASCFYLYHCKGLVLNITLTCLLNSLAPLNIFFCLAPTKSFISLCFPLKNNNLRV